MVLSKIKYQPQKLFKLKMFFTIIAVLLMLVQIYAVRAALEPLTKEFRKITYQDLETLQSGELVKGFISGSDVVMRYQEETGSGHITECILVLTENRKLIVFAAVEANAPNAAAAITNLGESAADTFEFIGKVGDLHGLTYDGLKINMTLHNIYYRYGVNEKSILGTAVVCADDNSQRWIALLVASIAGFVFLAVVIFFLQRKSLNNLVYGILVQKGYIQPELKVTKEDIAFDNTETYKGSENDSTSFYVNTDFEVNPNEREDYKFVPEKDNTVSDSSLGQFLASTGLYSHKKEKPVDKYPVEFYDGKVSDEGNFFIDKKADENLDIDGEKKIKY